jgi:putative nucleotidyltransferase with HDIG domain/PAS domain S-box-containing protein
MKINHKQKKTMSNESPRPRRQGAKLEARRKKFAPQAKTRRKINADLRGIFDAMGDPIHIIDRDLRFIQVNDAFKRWNKKLELETSIVNHSLFQVFPFLSDKIRDEYLQVFETGVMLVTEECTCLNGNEIFTETRKIPIIEQGTVTNVITVVRNITEERQFEKELKKNQERLQTLMDASPVAISWAAVEDGKLEYNNRAHRALFGYEIEDIPTIAEWRRKAFPDETYRTTVPSLISAVREAQQKGEELQPIEAAVTCKNGSIRFVMMTGAIVSNRVVAIFSDITKRREAEDKLKHSYSQLQETFISTVNALASTVEMKDPYTAGHQRWTTQLACAIAEEMGLSKDQIEGIRMAGLIHDIGKINIPAEILSKPGRLSDVQYKMVKVHPQVGCDILREIKFPWPVAKIVCQHHERFDGSGYPAGLSGNAIVLEARILAVADVVEAMASHRPYRVAHGLERAFEEILRNKGTLFDPQVVDACLTVFEKGFQFDESSLKTDYPLPTPLF